MSELIKAIEIGLKAKQARDTLKRVLLPETYARKTKEFGDTIRTLAEERSISNTAALIEITNGIPNDGMATLLFIAAWVEMTEGEAA